MSGALGCELRAFAAMRRGLPLAHPLSLSLAPGSVLGVVGPNGVGKSSLLAALAGAGVQHTGEVLLRGRVLREMPARERARSLALLTQDTRAPDELLVRELVAVGALAGSALRPADAVREALLALGLTELAARRFGTLSGGQQQLVQLARVLAQRTPVVVLDEPTSALDLLHQRVVERTMRDLSERGVVVIAALHDLNIALNACTHVLMLEAGGAAHVGAPGEVLSAERVHRVYGVRTERLTSASGRHVLTARDEREPALGRPPASRPGSTMTTPQQ